MSDPTRSDADPRPAMPDAPIELSGQEASQGRKSGHMIKVLIASLVLVVIVLFGLYALHARDLSTNHGAGGQSGVVNHTEADSFHAAPPSPKQAPPGMPDSRAASNTVS